MDGKTRKTFPPFIGIEAEPVPSARLVPFAEALLYNWRMPKPYRIAALSLSIYVALGALAAPEPAVVLSRVMTPIVFKETPQPDENLPGTSLVDFDFAASDMEVKLWHGKENFALEVIINVQKVNQAVLPVDSHGRLTRDAVALNGRPFVRFLVPGIFDKTVDVKCSRKVCRAMLPNFPYKQDEAQNIQIEVNIRGLKGRHWIVNFNQDRVERSAFKPETAPLPPPHVGIIRDFLYLQAEGAPAPYSIETWQLTPQANLAFHRVRRRTLFEIVAGPIFVTFTKGISLEFTQINTGDKLWLEPGDIVSLKSGPHRKATLRRLEYGLK